MILFFQKRVDVFMDLLDSRSIDKVSIDADQADALLYLLDAVVIKLEGGTEEDLQVLSIKPPKPMIAKDVFKEKEDNKTKSVTEKKSENRYFFYIILNIQNRYKINSSNVLINFFFFNFIYFTLVTKTK